MKLSSEYNAQRYGPGYYTDATGYPECAFNTKGYLYKYLSTHPKDIRSGLIKIRQMLMSMRLQQVIILPSILVRMLIST